MKTTPVSDDPKRDVMLPEWRTLFLIFAVYAVWALVTTLLAKISLIVAVPALALVLAMHSSLQHEALHGHPFRSAWLNGLLVLPALGWLIPYLRFRDTHLAHHRDEILTDPYDDPETNFFDPAIWERLPRLLQVVLTFNNTLFGRMLIGPLIAQIIFMMCDARHILQGQWRVLWGWLLHIPAMAPVLWWLINVGEMPIWAYAAGAYGAMSLLKIRTYLEHRAHDAARCRTVVIEDRGWLSFLFLNNNLHVVHHMHPGVPWYRLWALYQANRDRYLGRNGGYRFASYRDVFRRHFFHVKDPVAHPLWPGGASTKDV